LTGPVLRPAADCRYDLLALGEVMLRFDPGEGRIRTARSFKVNEGGGEYNVARGLRRCFGLRTAIVTALVDDEIGRLVEDLILTGGVDTTQVRWIPGDGAGRDVRNGLNFVERGFGVRGAVGASDRGHTAVSRMVPGEIDWDDLFGRLGVRWFHTGGIYAGLSDSTAEVAAEAIAAAHRHGTVVSYDLNYRASLWATRGGWSRAQALNRDLAQGVDVMIGLPESGQRRTPLSAATARAAIDKVVADFPNLAVIATTLRTVHSATVNDWGAIAWSRATGVVEAVHRPGLEILDRVGGGDSFASGLIYGLLASAESSSADLGTADLASAVEYGAAHGALAMTTPGDLSMATRTEVEALVRGVGAMVIR